MQRAMTIFNRTDLLAHLRRQLVIDLYSHHGIAHWARVRANGLMLANDTGANLHVVELFAFFHDARRLSEHTDDGHGSRGAVLARRSKAGILMRLTMRLICCNSPAAGTATGLHGATRRL